MTYFDGQLETLIERVHYFLFQSKDSFWGKHVSDFFYLGHSFYFMSKQSGNFFAIFKNVNFYISQNEN